MKSNFANLDNEVFKEVAFANELQDQKQSHSLMNMSCTCWRGHFRASLACKTCHQWSKVLCRLEGE